MSIDFDVEIKINWMSWFMFLFCLVKNFKVNVDLFLDSFWRRVYVKQVGVKLVSSWLCSKSILLHISAFIFTSSIRF